jgi:hypothetical protein
VSSARATEGQRGLTQSFPLRRVVEGTYVDEGFTNGLQQIFDLLWKTKDKAIVERFGLWLLQRDRALGLKASMSLVFDRTVLTSRRSNSCSAIPNRRSLSRLATSSARFAPSTAMRRISTLKELFCRRGTL